MSRRRAARRRLPAPVAVFAMVAVTVVAVLTVAAGLGIWPPQIAVAAPAATAPALGVEDATAIVLGPAVDSHEKFAAPAAAAVTAAAPKALLRPANKKAAPVPKAAPAPAQAPKAAAATKRTKRSAHTAASRGGWSSAKCSTYGIGDGLIGNGMAGGGVLRADSMVVAHRSLPFGTKIRFKYKGRTCVAEVRDRGPFIAGRIFDLGPGTAKALKFSGVGRVQYQIIGR